MSFTYFQELYWREPLWLLVMLQPFIILLLKKIIRQNNITLYAEKKFHPWIVIPSQIKSISIVNKNFTYILAWIFFAVALAGPRTPALQTDKEHFLGSNIMVIVDHSLSMKATDIAPNRIRRAKIELHELLEKAKNHRIGITVFAARPHIYVPLTFDHSILKEYLDQLDQLEFPTLGSDPASAILIAEKELAQLKGKSAIVLITDGDFSSVQKNKINEQILKLKQASIPLYILGVGTVEGEAIQVKEGSWLRYNQQPVISKMDEEYLRQLASLSGGKYSPVYDDNADWVRLYNDGIARQSSSITLNKNQKIVWNDHFVYFLFISTLLFWFSLSPYRFTYSKNTISILFIMTIICMTPSQEVIAVEFDFGFKLGQTSEQAAFRAYQKGHFAQANKLYQQTRGYNSYLGQGNSLYKMGDYQSAIQQFSLAVLNANTDMHRYDALYNLANSYFHSGAFDRAISSYEDALKYQPGNQYALFNLNVSKVLYENLQRRLKETEKIIRPVRQGQGPRSAGIEQGAEISENSSVSMDGTDNKTMNNIPLPDLPGIDEDKLKKLVALGLDNIKLAQSGNNIESIQGEAFSSAQVSSVSINEVAQQLDVISNSQNQLWKRIFEMEEGFPAPVKTPRRLPGVKPW